MFHSINVLIWKLIRGSSLLKHCGEFFIPKAADTKLICPMLSWLGEQHT